MNNTHYVLLWFLHFDILLGRRMVYCITYVICDQAPPNILAIYRVARKKSPELSHGVMQQSRWNESAEKHVCNEQTFSNMSVFFHLKRLHISIDTTEIVLHVIKQCLQAVRHLCCWLYAGYTRMPQ